MWLRLINLSRVQFLSSRFNSREQTAHLVSAALPVLCLTWWICNEDSCYLAMRVSCVFARLRLRELLLTDQTNKINDSNRFGDLQRRHA